jgi:hypothetical protein
MRATGGEDLIKIHSDTLDVPLGGEASLVANDVPVLIVLDFEHPFQADRTVTERQLHELPGVVVDNGVHLLGHGHPPACLSFCCSKGGRLLCRSEVVSAIELPLNEPRYCWHTEDGVESTESRRRVFVVVGIKVQFALR